MTLGVKCRKLATYIHDSFLYQKAKCLGLVDMYQSDSSLMVLPDGLPEMIWMISSLCLSHYHKNKGNLKYSHHNWQLLSCFLMQQLAEFIIKFQFTTYQNIHVQRFMHMLSSSSSSSPYMHAPIRTQKVST